jgi:hypothetical protein
MKNLLVLGIAIAILSPANAQHRHNRGGNYNHGHNRGAIVHTQRSPVQIRINVGIPVRRNPVYIAPRTQVVYNNCNSCNHNRGCNHNSGNRHGSYSAFEDLIYQLRNSSYESDKLIIAKQAVRGNGYSADQIGDIMMEFSYESSRLEFAKFAYGFCINPDQYYQVNSAFQYSSSIDELDRFIH